jgi:hypothetical protein
MAACTFAVGTADTGNTPNSSGAFTPALDDLLVAFVIATGTVTDAPTLTSSVSGFTFTTVNRAEWGGNVNRIWAFVADALVSSATSQTVSIAPVDAATGTIIFVFRVSGMSKVGSAAIKQSDFVSEGAAGSTPSFGIVNPVSTNPVLLCLGNSTNPAGMTPPTNYTEPAGGDLGFASPTCGGEVVFRNSGQTTGLISWGNTSSAFGIVGLELDASASGTAFTQTLTGGLTPAGGVIKAANQLKVGGLTPGGTVRLVKAVVQGKAGALTPAGTIQKLVDKKLAGSITPSGTKPYLKANDDFTEGGGNVGLASHTPTGTDAGSGWTVTAGTVTAC